MALDPHINPKTGVWDDNYFANHGSGNSTADQYYNQAAGKENDYINSLLAQAGGSRDLAVKQLNAQHQLALGNNDDATAKFLESVADNLEAQTGRIPYDYNLYTGRENTGYGIQSAQNAGARSLALAKLAEDERSQNATLNLAQGQGNQSTAEDINARGLAYGAQPTGLTGGAPTTQQLGGFQGIGGYAQNANNQDFANQRLALANSIGLGRQGANQQADFAQQNLNFAHANTLQDLRTSARRDTQDAQNNQQFGLQGANLNYAAQQAALERQRQQLLLQDRQNANTKAGITGGVLGY